MLVHGEPERNDMVEYFGELLEGFAFTQNGWVQSYGSRCVKPPVIFGDVARRAPMTVEWIKYAQALTSRPVKGMLTALLPSCNGRLFVKTNLGVILPFKLRLPSGMKSPIWKTLGSA